MKVLVQKAKLHHRGEALLRKGEFLRLYSQWHETHDATLEKKLLQSFDRLIESEPGFDFRKMLWKAL
jgi:hypothetical protein